MTLALPYRDDSRTPLAFSLAVLLHVLLAMAVVGVFLFKQAPAPVQTKVFELVAAPPSDSTTDEAAAPGPPSMSLPNLSVPNIPRPPQPVPQAPPQPSPSPAPAVTRPSAPPKPTPTHATTVPPKLPANHPAPTDYQTFLKEHKFSNTPAPPAASGRPVPTVSVNVRSIVKNLENSGGGANGQARGHANTASAAQDQSYIDKLRERLKEAFVPPGGITGLSAEVYLVIGPNGELVKKELSRSSGKAEFDDAVRQALQQLTNVDPPPGGVQVSYYFTYTPDGE